MNKERLLVSLREAAQLLGVSQRTLWTLTAPRGPIPCVRLGLGKRKRLLYPLAELQAWLSREVAAQIEGARRGRGSF